jgi:HlyD family secretion protein
MTRPFLLLVAVSVGVLFLSNALRSIWVSPAAEVSAYQTAVVERGDLISTVTAGGNLNAVVLVEVGSQISGQVKDLFADFNSAVTQGQVIARIDSETYEAKVAQVEAELEIAQAALPVQQAQIARNSAELDNAKSSLAVAKAQTARAELALDDAKRDLDRKQPLAEQAIVSASDFERVESAYGSAQSQVIATQAQELSRASSIRAAEAALRMAEAQLTTAAAEVKRKQAALRQAQIDLERTYIRAPVTGTVVNRKVNRGQTVAASLQAPTLFTIAQDLRQMQVEAAVVEADVSRFAIGLPVTFAVDAHPGRHFTGKVKQLRKAPQSLQKGVTYTVVISADNQDEVLLLPGMTANLQVVVARKADALKVPNEALRFRPSDRPQPATEGAIARPPEPLPSQPGVSGQVFVLGRDNQLTSVPLRLGITDGRSTEVLAGEVAEGRAVVIGTASAGASPASGPLATLRLR